MFFKEFIFNTKEVGSIIPSSSFLTKKIISNINFEDAKVIIELGSGTGVFSDKIVKNKKKETLFLLFEVNEVFYNLLLNRYSIFENVFVFREKAENLNKILETLNIFNIDYVVSGLPLLNFQKDNRKLIFNNINKYLKCTCILFQYTRVLENEFSENYKILKRERVYLNFPPAYVYLLSKKN